MKSKVNEEISFKPFKMIVKEKLSETSCIVVIEYDMNENTFEIP